MRPFWIDHPRSSKVIALYERDGGICGICHQPVDLFGDNPATVDHVIPKSKGGTDDWSNLQIAHRKCNSGKSGRTQAQYADFITAEAQRLEKRGERRVKE